MSSNLRLGFIGCGGIAQRQLASVQKLPGVEVVAVSDLREESIEAFRQKTPEAKAFLDWRALVHYKDLDAVSVCTPNHLHREQSILALQYGKHVLVEKPMAMNVGEAIEMEEASKKAKRVLQIGFQERFSPAARLLKKQAENGFFGDILHVRVLALRRRGIPNWGVYGQMKAQGGGPLIDFGIHWLEMAHYLMGNPEPVTASGTTFRYFGTLKSSTISRWPNWDNETYDVEDMAVGFLRFANGATLSIETSFVAQIEKDISQVQIMGSKGGAITEPLLLFSDFNDYMMTMSPQYMLQEPGFDAKMRHFIECARDGIKCEAPAKDGVAVQKMIEGLYKSANEKKEVAL